MGKNYGYIKLYRDIQNHFLWQEKPFDKARAWLDLLMLANYTEQKTIVNGTVQVVGKGQLFTSRKKLADRWGWNVKKVDRYLGVLSGDTMITVDGTPNGTTLTIENYSIYQCEGYTNGTADGTTDGITDGITDGTLLKKDNKDNKDKKDKKDNKASDFVFLIESYDENIYPLLERWLNLCVSKKGCVTDEVIKQNLEKLNAFANESKLSVAEYLSEVIRRGWATFYPIKPAEECRSVKASYDCAVKPSYDLEEFAKRSVHGEIVYKPKHRRNDKL